MVTPNAGGGPSEMLARVLKLLAARRSGNQWVARCPAHDDHNPSLSITERGGRILLKCHADCTNESIVAALGLTMADLFTDNEPGAQKCIVAIYDYVDEAGTLLYQKLRNEPKEFKQRRPDGNGGWIWDLKGVRRVPYHLPELRAAKNVLLVEGEKDADAAFVLGLIASSDGTAGQRWPKEWTAILGGKDVTIIADADDPGRKLAQQVAAALFGKAASVKVLELPGAKDLSEWLERGGDRAQLEAMIRQAPDWKPQLGAHAQGVTPWLGESIAEFLADDGAEVTALYAPLLYPETITEIFSPRGIGKSVLALHVAIVLARNGKRVLYIDRDNPRRVIRERLRSWGADEDLANLKFISRENCPPLTKAELWAQFPYDSYDAVILDSFDSLAEGIGEQDSGKPSRAIAPILDIAHRKNGPAVLVLGNCVKNAKHSRGSGVVEDRADIVFEVRDATGFHPAGTKPWIEELPAQGAADWASRSSRRNHREQFRLAFICTKFRLAEEPAPFIQEISTVIEPWSLRNVTDEVDREGASARERRAREKADATLAAIESLRLEIIRREQAGEAGILKTQAETYLAQQTFKRQTAREAIASPSFELAGVGGKGQPQVVRLADKNQRPGRNGEATEPPKILGKDDADFCRPHKQGTAEINPHEPQHLPGLQDGVNSAAGSFFPLPKSRDSAPHGDVEVGEI